jgi:hypothetical protein
MRIFRLGVFWFIIDHDDLHKEFVLPFARDLEKQLGSPNFNRERFTKQWIPMVNKGCQLYYKKNKLKDDPAEIFNKELRKGICEKLSEKFMDEISNNSYRIGKHTK